MSKYGKELVLDIHNCSFGKSNRKQLKAFLSDLCKIIGMQKGPLYFWDYKGFENDYLTAEPHLKGTSAVQFITTSNIVIHVLDDLQRIYFNIFSCKDFNSKKVEKFCLKSFGGVVKNKKEVNRI